jgi:ribosomal-protein-alanine N-acetyltransferase
VEQERKSGKRDSPPSEQFRLRQYRPDDLSWLSGIDQQCFPPGIAYDRKELSAYIHRSGSLTLVAETPPDAKDPGSASASLICGFIVAQKLRRGVGHIITIDVLPQARRAGLGSKLMSEVEQRLHEAGCEAVLLEVAVNNLAAIRFYKTRGYFVLKTIPRYYQGELDALLMAKRLQ